MANIYIGQLMSDFVADSKYFKCEFDEKFLTFGISPISKAQQAWHSSPKELQIWPLTFL